MEMSLLYSKYKHHLKNSWTLWFVKPTVKPGLPRLHRLLEVGTFSTIEDFWCLFNHIKAVSVLPPGSEYCLFKKGITPMWEDVRNKNGGKWLVTIPRDITEHDLNRFWVKLVLDVTKETFGFWNGNVNGVTINLRANINTISLWTSEYGYAYDVIGIGMRLKEITDLPLHEVITYQAHAECFKTKRCGLATIKNEYYI